MIYIMIYTIPIAILLFLLVYGVLYYFRHDMLIDTDVDELSDDIHAIFRVSKDCNTKIRGSVRLSQGKIITRKELEELEQNIQFP